RRPRPDRRLPEGPSASSWPGVGVAADEGGGARGTDLAPQPAAAALRAFYEAGGGNGEGDPRGGGRMAAGGKGGRDRAGGDRRRSGRRRRQGDRFPHHDHGRR